MEKDKTGNERLEYDQQIVETERRMDELMAEKKKIREHMDSLNIELQQGFRELQNLNEDLIKNGDYSAQWRQDENEGKRQFLSQLFDKSKDELESICRSENQKLEDTRSRLQKERNALSSD